MSKTNSPASPLRLAILAAACLGFSGALSGAWGVTPSAAPLSGYAQVIDGDTLDIAGARVRLEGIDAPEMAQTCVRGSGTSWSCGREAQKALERMTRDQVVMCDPTGTDKYHRTLALCFAGGESLNAALIKAGLARAFVKYSNAFVAEERAAQAARLGIWQGDNIAPWEFRAGRWSSAESGAPAGCAIKGNVSSKGRIYHVPWSTWYDKVKVDEARGERWFCSEDEAISAGWRSVEQR